MHFHLQFIPILDIRSQYNLGQALISLKIRGHKLKVSRIRGGTCKGKVTGIRLGKRDGGIAIGIFALTGPKNGRPRQRRKIRLDIGASGHGRRVIKPFGFDRCGHGRAGIGIVGDKDKLSDRIRQKSNRENVSAQIERIVLFNTGSHQEKFSDPIVLIMHFHLQFIAVRDIRRQNNLR